MTQPHNSDNMALNCWNNELHGAESFLRGCQSLNYSRIFQYFMEPEDSLPCSQEPSAGPHSEPDKSSSSNPIQSYLSKRNVILPSHLRLGLPSRFFPSGFPIKIV
jgi:hypothetical protein